MLVCGQSDGHLRQFDDGIVRSISRCGASALWSRKLTFFKAAFARLSASGKFATCRVSRGLAWSFEQIVW
jgi:hypothetical protein